MLSVNEVFLVESFLGLIKLNSFSRYDFCVKKITSNLVKPIFSLTSFPFQNCRHVVCLLVFGLLTGFATIFLCVVSNFDCREMSYDLLLRLLNL